MLLPDISPSLAPSRQLLLWGSGEQILPGSRWVEANNQSGY